MLLTRLRLLFNPYSLVKLYTTGVWGSLYTYFRIFSNPYIDILQPVSLSIIHVTCSPYIMTFAPSQARVTFVNLQKFHSLKVQP